MKLTEESKHPINEARAKHPEIFEGVGVESDQFIEALSRWAREFPEEAAAYEKSFSTEGTFPMKILDYWDEIELFAKQYPGMDINEIIKKWIAANPGKLKEEGKAGFGGSDIPTGVRD